MEQAVHPFIVDQDGDQIVESGDAVRDGLAITHQLRQRLFACSLSGRFGCAASALALLDGDQIRRSADALRAQGIQQGRPLAISRGCAHVSDYMQAQHRLVDQITQVIESLAQFPDRGAHPPELLGLGIREFRQTGFKPYRVIYRVQDDRVVIHLIIDGRRDLQSLLARRLLGA